MSSSTNLDHPKRGRGRPRGSKNGPNAGAVGRPRKNGQAPRTQGQSQGTFACICLKDPTNAIPWVQKWLKEPQALESLKASRTLLHQMVNITCCFLLFPLISLILLPQRLVCQSIGSCLNQPITIWQHLCPWHIRISIKSDVRYVWFFKLFPNKGLTSSIAPTAHPDSVWRSGPVRFLGPRGHGPRPRPVHQGPRTSKNRTGPLKTG